MATASSEAPPPAGRSPVDSDRSWRLKPFFASIGRSWMFVAFFVGFFLFWEFSIDIFSIPFYILPKPTQIVANASADIPRLLEYTWITGTEALIGYLLAIALAVPLGLGIAFSSILR